MHKSLLPLFLLALLIAGCFGGATETETGTAQITGEVAWPDGRPVAGARIRLRAADFLAGSPQDPTQDGIILRDTVTDASGRFIFRQVRPGDYLVEVLHTEGFGAIARFKVAPGAVRIDVGVLELQSLVAITGRVRFSDSTLGPASVQVLGTEHAAVADSATGLFTLRDMPPGVHDLGVSTPVPFFPAKVFSGRVAEGTATVQVGDLILDKGSKQAFTSAGGKLVFAGIDGSNPLFYDNDFGPNTWDNEFLWALASLGRVDLRGNLATLLAGDTQAAMLEEFPKWTREARICRLSGMRNIPEPILGATRKLALPASGRWQEILPESNPGIRLLIAEARKASVAKPLVVVAGGQLTTVANALLLDPYIADKMVVFGVYNQGLNGDDSLASFLVARKSRFVEWGRDYFWAGPGPSAGPLPGNWLGQRLKASRDTAAFPPLFFADFAALAFLADDQAWKSARGAKAVSAPLNTALEALEPFDFIDIPQKDNDWAAMDRVFFAALANPDAFHPWPVPGTIAGVSFRAMSGISVDSVPGEGDVAGEIGPGDWLEYTLEAASAGTFDLILRNRCEAMAVVRISGEDAATRSDPTLPTASAWGETRIRLYLKQGVQTIRIATASGTWHLGGMRWESR